MDRSKSEEMRIEQLYREMYEKMLIYASCALKDQSLAEEAVQDTFCVACGKMEALFSSPNPQGWLMEALRNTIRNMRRQRAKLSQLLLFSLNSDELPVTAACDNENVDILYGDLAVQRDFQLLKRIVLDNYTMLEAAEEFGISLDVCKKRVQRVRKLLQKKFSRK